MRSVRDLRPGDHVFVEPSRRSWVNWVTLNASAGETSPGGHMLVVNTYTKSYAKP